MPIKFEVYSFNGFRDIRGSQNSISGSRDPYITPFGLILHFFSLVLTAIGLHAKFEVSSFNRSRDIRGSQYSKSVTWPHMTIFDLICTAMIILCVCLSVCLSVRLSVKRVHCDKTEERSVQIFIPYEKSFSLSILLHTYIYGVGHSKYGVDTLTFGDMLLGNITCLIFTVFDV